MNIIDSLVGWFKKLWHKATYIDTGFSRGRLGLYARILGKYLTGRKVDPEDEPFMDELQVLRLIHVGFSDTDKTFCLTAKTTTLGRHFVEIKRIESNRWRRFLYSISRWL